jgi:hypothetical protein
MTFEIDVWVRGAQHAKTHHVDSIEAKATDWGEAEVRQLVTEMLLALNREKHPGAEPPPLTMRGFSWIVSPFESGVVLHLEMHIGTVSAGPFPIGATRLTELMTRMIKNDAPKASVH